ncbi:MAG: hypothetical protein HYY20_03745 [Candidatus Tectomicrobia bacterium]|uniref:Uncharacterized protein n=1 Tax=Tectimicrobiota bacterium TaxID=2528274 RepID=A0A932CMV3_UNCTE|nr:hypothetical protein [Candidatus Tectomicrobia bacterium]
MPPRTFYCPVGIAFDIPVEWEVISFQSTEVHFRVRDETSVCQDSLRLSILGPESNTLSLALGEVKRGAWGPRIRNVQPVRLGKLEALRLELTPEEDCPLVIWLVISPSDRVAGFIPYGDPARVEGVLATLRGVTVRKGRE